MNRFEWSQSPKSRIDVAAVLDHLQSEPSLWVASCGYVAGGLGSTRGSWRLSTEDKAEIAGFGNVGGYVSLRSKVTASGLL